MNMIILMGFLCCDSREFLKRREILYSAEHVQLDRVLIVAAAKS